MDTRPLILTLELDAAAFAWFDDLRRAHFPPERNMVPAHLTLFHALPGDRLKDVEAALAEATSAGPPALQVTGARSLGRGVAYTLVSPALQDMRAELARRFAPWLTRQDQAPFRPHVTVQNKVDPDTARRLLETLQHEFEPFEVAGEALLLWRYPGGPWAEESRWPFGR